MGHFIYFIPKIKSVTEKNIDNAGIFEGAKDLKIEYRQIVKGPDGMDGMAFSFETKAGDNNRPFIVGYFQEKQTWIKANGGKFWIGYYNDAKPTAESLMRKEQVNGHYVKLLNGQDWLIPVARLFPEGTILPHSLVLGPDGDIVKEIIPRYAKYSQIGERVWTEFKRQMNWEDVEEDHKPFNEQEEWECAIRALSINYLVGQWEVSALRLLSTNNVQNIFHAIVDIPTMMAVIKSQNESAKKKENADTPDGSTIDDGEQTS
jgi:hypothetical protein